MGGTGTGPVESGSPASNLGFHQWLRLPSGSVYEYFGGLRYRTSDGEKHQFEFFAGHESCIRIFRPVGSDTVQAFLSLPKEGSAYVNDIEANLVARLGIIEGNKALVQDDLNNVDNISDRCTIYRNHSGALTGASPFVDGDLYRLVRQYSDSLGERYKQEGEKLGRAVGVGAGGVASVAANALMLAGMSELKLEHVVVAAVYTVASMYVGSKFCGWGFGRSAKRDAHEILRKRLLKGHKDETDLHSLARFIQRDYQQTDVLKTRDQALDGAFSSLARTPAGEGMLIQWKGLSYDQVIARCEMLLGVKPVQYVPSSERAAIIVPEVARESTRVAVPEVKVTRAVAPSKCPHCQDGLQNGDSCITGMLNGAPTQAHAECSGEMIASSGDWLPISGAYAYESLVDHTSVQPEKKKEERRVKE